MALQVFVGEAVVGGVFGVPVAGHGREILDRLDQQLGPIGGVVVFVEVVVSLERPVDETAVFDVRADKTQCHLVLEQRDVYGPCSRWLSSPLFVPDQAAVALASNRVGSGRPVMMRTVPPADPRPNSVPCGPRNISIRSRS